MHSYDGFDGLVYGKDYRKPQKSWENRWFPVKIFAEQFSPNARLMALDPPIVIACVAANSNQSVDINPLLWGFS